MALLCALTAASLVVTPPMSQFHTMERFQITCPSASWTFHRITDYTPTPESCRAPWGTPRGASCIVKTAMVSSSGQYWCQDPESQCTERVNITVSYSKVILRTPVFAVNEGKKVTLKCSYKASDADPARSDFNASFYRQGEFVGSSPGGEMVLEAVSPDDEGLYQCEHVMKHVRSPQSRLSVIRRVVPQPSVPPTPALPLTTPSLRPKGFPLPRLLCSLGLFLLYTLIMCVAVATYCKWRRARAEQKQDYVNVSLRTIRDC
ncbi:unnamed protein product [Knipowitschia caucasica]|uniref:Ig-like domain-containing protein n=1 Tax=Knipowitschia caucasica TaxID=637954 RepID=A0AAV2KIK9_KNICA